MKLFLNVDVTDADIHDGTHYSEWCPVALAIRRLGAERVKVSASAININMYGMKWECYRDSDVMEFVHHYDMTNVEEPRTFSLEFLPVPAYVYNF